MPVGCERKELEGGVVRSGTCDAMSVLEALHLRWGNKEGCLVLLLLEIITCDMCMFMWHGITLFHVQALLLPPHNLAPPTLSEIIPDI